MFVTFYWGIERLIYLIFDFVWAIFLLMPGVVWGMIWYHLPMAHQSMTDWLLWLQSFLSYTSHGPNIAGTNRCGTMHDDVIAWKGFPHCWPFVWESIDTKEQSFADFFVVILNKPLNKQLSYRRYQTPKSSRDYNDYSKVKEYITCSNAVWALRHLKLSPHCLFNRPGLQ